MATQMKHLGLYHRLWQTRAKRPCGSTFHRFTVACHLRELRARSSRAREKNETRYKTIRPVSAAVVRPRSPIRRDQAHRGMPAAPPWLASIENPDLVGDDYDDQFRCQPDMLNEYGSFVEDRRERSRNGMRACTRVITNGDQSPSNRGRTMRVVPPESGRLRESYCCHPRCLSTSAHRSF